jgi:hypothetical protein
MKEENAFSFNMTPIRVWMHLAELSAFTLWHPSYRFQGDAAPKKSIELSHALFRGEYRVKAEATITTFDKLRAIGWMVGIGGVSVFRETYELEAFGSGAQIRHALEFQGLFGRLIGVFLRRGLRQTLRVQDAALANFLKKEIRSAVAGINRHHRKGSRLRAASRKGSQ